MLASQTKFEVETPNNPAKLKNGPTQQTQDKSAAKTALIDDKNDFIAFVLKN